MRLFVESGPLAGIHVELDREHPTTLGSGEGCTIRVQDPGVAAEHAVVKALRDEGFGVKALAPGLRLNGVEIEASPLKDGDVLEVGTTRLAYGQERQTIGPQVTGFRILGELGRGGMGTVYRAEQVSLHRQVALKVLDRKLLRDPQFVARFVAEARAAAKLSHPNVVHVFDVDHEGETYYYSMEVMHHGSLEAWLRKHGRMPVERALQVVADAASGLAYAESLGMVHRDIKPDNLMLDQHGTVKIADLGLARTEEDAAETLTGTPHFMAPEQVLRRPVDHRSDLYALGCTFYRLVTGRTPFKGQAVKDILRAHVKDTAEPAHKVEPSVPAEVSAIIQRLMAKEPADRYQSAAELLDAVTTMLQPPARRGLWIGLAAAAVVVAGVTIWWAVTRPEVVREVERKYDDPEKQQFADELKVLRGRTREDAATIALLRVRLEGSQGLPLARALDELAAAHAGTAAAAEATALAGRLRGEVADREAVAARGRQAANEGLAVLAQRIDAALQTGDLGMGQRAAAAATAPAGADAVLFAAGLAEQRERIRAAARDRLAGYRRSIETARGSGDVETLRTTAAGLERVLAADGGWPAELLPDRPGIERSLAMANQGIAELQAESQAAAWQRYDRRLADPEGPLAAVRRGDFAAASRSIEALADELGDSPPGMQARALAAATARAAQFADALAAAAGQGTLTVALLGEAPLPLQRWQRDQGTFVLQDNGRKPGKEVVVPCTAITPEQWAALAAQVPNATQEGQACFIGFLALCAHLDRARTWLGSIRPADDDSGTGAAGYPFGPLIFEQALKLLPDAKAPWSDGIRQELDAARLLAAGLRALSERRNLAAATHLERLLGEHAHSLAVVALP